MQITIDAPPPTCAQIEKEKATIQDRIKRFNTYNTALTIITAATSAAAACALVPGWQETLGIHIPADWATIPALLSMAASVFFAYPAIASGTIDNEQALQKLAPMPKGMRQNTLRLCNMHPTCERYRQAVAAQGRQLLWLEAETICQWHNAMTHPAQTTRRHSPGTPSALASKPNAS